MQLSTGFHCTRVKSPNVQDWRRLRHVMGHMWLTRFLPLIVKIDDNGNACVRIDGAHAAHDDGRGHSGLHVAMGKGGIINQSRKLGVGTASSTETQIVSAGERFPKCAWFRHFRLAQGDLIKEDILMQDNKSNITIHKNCPHSSRKGAKHAHAQYFFVADKIKRRM